MSGTDTDRAARLAEALRANLRRRKAQSREAVDADAKAAEPLPGHEDKPVPDGR